MLAGALMVVESWIFLNCTPEPQSVASLWLLLDFGVWFLLLLRLRSALIEWILAEYRSKIDSLTSYIIVWSILILRILFKSSFGRCASDTFHQKMPSPRNNIQLISVACNALMLITSVGWGGHSTILFSPPKLNPDHHCQIGYVRRLQNWMPSFISHSHWK